MSWIKKFIKFISKVYKGYLMNENDYERLESLIGKAVRESIRNDEVETSLAMTNALRSRDCNFLECYDKFFQRTQNNN